MIIRIPIRAIPSQSFMSVINDVAFTFHFYQREGSMYCDLNVDDNPIWYGLICHDRTPMKERRTTIFSGNLMFVDLEGTEDPTYPKLDSRFVLVYISDDVVDQFDTRFFQLPIGVLDEFGEQD